MSLIMFQFQNGTIKLRLEHLEKAVEKMFQFQNGTIKFNCLKIAARCVISFQFQNGTIKFISSVYVAAG